MQKTEPPKTPSGWDALPPYEARRVQFRELLTVDQWTLKMYGVAVGDAVISAALAESAATVARSAVPMPPITATRYGAGFVMAHESVSTAYVLVCWWDERNEVHQRIFSGPAGAHYQLQPHDSRVIGCVWELAVTDFERRAWIQHVMKNPARPDFGAYFAQQMNDHV